ncbi:MAG: hypothetical protein VSS75_002530 [Candidatus Parabeggiatoa sp.]|nr:hypothetical protein [Candidatus Parabeggiatoa sp.]
MPRVETTLLGDFRNAKHRVETTLLGDFRDAKHRVSTILFQSTQQNIITY